MTVAGKLAAVFFVLLVKHRLHNHLHRLFPLVGGADRCRAVAALITAASATG